MTLVSGINRTKRITMQLREKIKLLRSGKIEEKERRQILSLFHQPENEFEIKTELVNQLAEEKQDVSYFDETKFEKLWMQIQERSSSARMTKKYNLRLVYHVAAVLIIALLTGNILLQYFTSTDEVFHTAIAPRGAIAQIIMPDNSKVILNAGSRIRYSIGGKKKGREVYLSGEAWFDVEKAKDSPFVVHTSAYDVRVTGTKFNVKAYDDDREVTTTLEEGTIRILPTSNCMLSNDMEIKPGEQVSFLKDDRNMIITKVDPSFFSSWKENKLVFNNTSLKDIFKMLERKYGVVFIVEDKEVLNYHYDGVIHNETIVQVMEILERTTVIEYSINHNQITIRKERRK